MKNYTPDNSSSSVSVFVVGKTGDKFTDYATGLFGGLGIKTINCCDVYSAMYEIAVNKTTSNKAADILVVGRIEDMLAENGRFFSKAAENGFTCCCLADVNSRQSNSIKAKDKGAFVINTPEQLKELADEIFAVNKNPHNKKPASFQVQPIAVTEAELNALFES